MASDSLHENSGKLGQEIIDQHHAIVSLMEELEAVDWYSQRAKATENPELRAILEHNRDEEKEYAAMVLEWLRRGDPKLNEHLRAILFTEGPLTAVETAMKQGGSGDGEGEEVAASADGSLGIGNLRPASGRGVE